LTVEVTVKVDVNVCGDVWVSVTVISTGCVVVKAFVTVEVTVAVLTGMVEVSVTV
jgi:hypothetical protein